MKKNKLYIFLSIMIAVILFIATITCTKTKPPSKQDKWKEEVEQSNKDIKKEPTVIEETGSKQPEDIPELDEQDKSIHVTLKGIVNSDTLTAPITITIDKENDIVEGEATLAWLEEIEIYEEGDEDHHSDRYTCVVELRKGTIFGIIDERGNINATISGFSYSDFGYIGVGKSTDEICSLCMQKIERKLENFIWNGKYNEETQQASGLVLPQGWKWWTN